MKKKHVLCESLENIRKTHEKIICLYEILENMLKKHENCTFLCEILESMRKHNAKNWVFHTKSSKTCEQITIMLLSTQFYINK